MPILATIQYPQGKDPTIVGRLLKDIADVLMKDLNEPPEHVRVTINEIATNRYSAGGVMAYKMNVSNGVDTNEKK
jgi:phenylpyruvate tautomerase PptA (4-oxalocrotonate tautomerase family)